MTAVIFIHLFILPCRANCEWAAVMSLTQTDPAGAALMNCLYEIT